MPRVLVVDDSRVILSVVQTYLSGLDLEVEVVTSATTGLKRLTEVDVDLVVSDINMPGMDGFEFARHIRALHGSVKVILTSAAKKTEGAEAAQRRQVDVFLPKPIDGEALRRNVVRLLGLGDPGRPAGRESLPPSWPTSSRNPPGHAIRVVLADDTQVGRRILGRILRADPGFELVAEACDGLEAVNVVVDHRPQLVLLDLAMPKLDGIAAARRIMRDAPTRIVIITEREDVRQASSIFEATRAGALDFLQRPAWGDAAGPAAIAFRDRLRMLADVPVIRPRASAGVSVRPRRPTRPESTPAAVVAFVGSTGGPALLASLLPRLHGVIASVPVLIVQHLLAGYASGFASWLTGVVGAEVRVAADGDPVVAGHVLLAPDDGACVTVSDAHHVAVTTEHRGARSRASGNMLLESVARAFGDRAVAVLLTGMGDDGAEGARSVRSHGGIVLAQSPDSCVVAGMPNAAIAMGVVHHVLSPEDLAAEIVSLTRQRA